MRVLAVAKRLDELAREHAPFRILLAIDIREPIRDRRIVSGGAGEGASRERFAQGKRRRPVMRRHFVEHEAVVGRLGDDGDARVVLGAGADESRAADVDRLDAGGDIGAARGRLLEGIEIDHEKVDRRDRVLFERALMRLVAAHREQPAMDLRMQRLDAPIHHLRPGRDLGNVDDLEPGIAQELGGAAGRDDLDPVTAERLGELGESRLVADREQRAFDLALFHDADGSSTRGNPSWPGLSRPSTFLLAKIKRLPARRLAARCRSDRPEDGRRHWHRPARYSTRS